MKRRIYVPRKKVLCDFIVRCIKDEGYSVRVPYSHLNGHSNLFGSFGIFGKVKYGEKLEYEDEALVGELFVVNPVNGSLYKKFWHLNGYCVGKDFNSLAGSVFRARDVFGLRCAFSPYIKLNLITISPIFDDKNYNIKI